MPSSLTIVPTPLHGEIRPSGSKNVALPVLAATLLAPGVHTLVDVPTLLDVDDQCALLRSVGCRVLRFGDRVVVDSTEVLRCEPDPEVAGRIRGSILLSGPLLARLGRAEVALPGGCAIGARPIDAHLAGLAALGARASSHPGGVRLDGGLSAGLAVLPFPSVTATEVVMMAAAACRGRSTLVNVAREPEIVALAAFLEGLGARVAGAGTPVITVDGGGLRPGPAFALPTDRVEAATWMAAAAASGGDLRVLGVDVPAARPILEALAGAGVAVVAEGDDVRVRGRPKRGFDLTTGPWPAFPTDAQQILGAVAAVAPGPSRIRETVYERRFTHLPELIRLGARTRVIGDTACFSGARLRGGRVTARDLRCGAALVVAALAADGPVTIDGFPHVRRGYADLEGKLAALGVPSRADLALAGAGSVLGEGA